MGADMTVEDMVSSILLKPCKTEIVDDAEVLDSVFEMNSLEDDLKLVVGPYVCSYRKTGIDSVPSDTYKNLSIFRLALIGTESYNLLSDMYIPTAIDSGHTSNNLKTLHIVNISIIKPLDCKEENSYYQDPFLKALLLLNLPINSDCLLLDDTLAHLKDLNNISELTINLQIKNSLSVKHKKLLSNQYSFDNSLSVLSINEQKDISSKMSKYFPLLHLPTTSEEAQCNIESDTLRISSLQSFCIYQNLKLFVSKVFFEHKLYSNKSIYIVQDRVNFPIKETGTFNFKVCIIETDRMALDSSFWCLLNRGLIFDSNSFNSYVELSGDETAKTDVYTESKNDNIPYKSTCYELLLRLILDTDLIPYRKSIEEAILIKDFDSVISVISELPIFKE